MPKTKAVKEREKEGWRERTYSREEGSEGRGSLAGFGDGRQWRKGERVGFLSSTFRIEERRRRRWWWWTNDD